jgi:hypothetical protein
VQRQWLLEHRELDVVHAAQRTQQVTRRPQPVDVHEEADSRPDSVADRLQPVEVGVDIASAGIGLDRAVGRSLLDGEVSHASGVLVPSHGAVHLDAVPVSPAEQCRHRHSKCPTGQVEQRGVHRGGRERRKLQHPGEVGQQRSAPRRVLPYQDRLDALLDQFDHGRLRLRGERGHRARLAVPHLVVVSADDQHHIGRRAAVGRAEAKRPLERHRKGYRFDRNDLQRDSSILSARRARRTAARPRCGHSRAGSGRRLGSRRSASARSGLGRRRARA